MRVWPVDRLQPTIGHAAAGRTKVMNFGASMFGLRCVLMHANDAPSEAPESKTIEPRAPDVRSN